MQALEKAEKALSREKDIMAKLEAETVSTDTAYRQGREEAGALPADLDPSDTKSLSEAIVDGSEALGAAKERAEYAASAVARQRGRVNDAKRVLIAAHADVEAENVKEAQQALSTHRKKVDALLDQLREVDGCGYVEEWKLAMASRAERPGTPVKLSSTTRKLSAKLRNAQARERVLRDFLRTGELTRFHGGVQFGQQLTGAEQPAILFGPDAELPDDTRPEPQPVPAYAKTWAGAGAG